MKNAPPRAPRTLPSGRVKSFDDNIELLLRLCNQGWECPDLALSFYISDSLSSFALFSRQ